MSCGVGHRHGSDPALLGLWCRPAAAAPIRPLAWEPPCATGAALKDQTKKKQKKQKKQKNKTHLITLNDLNPPSLFLKSPYPFSSKQCDLSPETLTIKKPLPQ